MPTIAEQVAELPAAPSEGPMAAFGAERARLAQAPAPAGVMPLGDTLPDAELLDPHGVPVAFAEALAGRRAVVVFYRGAWCPFCNIALRTYESELLPGVRERGVGLVAVSPQATDGSLSMQEKHALTFTVLSDPGNRLAGSLGVLTAPGDETRAAQLELGLDIEAINADGTTTLPMPTVAIVDPDRTLRWIDVHPDYGTRSEASEILAALDALGG